MTGMHPPTEPSPAAQVAARRLPLMLDIGVFLLRVAEALCIAAASLLALGAFTEVSPELRPPYINATIIAILFYTGLAELTGVHDADVRFSLRQAWGRLLTAWLATAMFMLTLSFFLQVSDRFSRGWAVGWFLSGGVALCAVRLAGIGWMRRLKKSGLFDQRVAIFGAGPQGDRLARYIQGSDRLTIELVGFFDDRTPDRLPPAQASLGFGGSLVELIALIREGRVDQVIVALPWSAEARLQQVVGELAVTPVRIRLAPDLASFAFAQRTVVLLGDLPVMTLFERPISGIDQLLKRAEDLLLGSLALVVLCPLLAAVALAVRFDSAGPILFRQEREGFNNHRFRILKFRTMYADRCDTRLISQATRDDPRVTRIGRILRRLSLDELPQLFNVLQGSMSLVGPRPHAPGTRAGDRLFGEVVKTYAARHKVKPGMTGWAQVSGWRGETDTEEKLLKRLEHDLYYIEHWSIGLDLYILLRTAAILPFQKRAY